MMRRGLAVVLAASTLCGCVSVRDYAGPPADPVPPGTGFARGANAAYASEEPVIEWWRELGDETLDTLITQTFANNRDLAAAEANLRAARAFLRLRQREFLPNGEVGASYRRQGVAENAQVFPDIGSLPDIDLFDVGFDAGWELDLFGRLSGRRDVARARYEATIASRDDLLVSLAAETASAYVALRGAQQQLLVARRNAENQRATYRLTEVLLKGGRGTRLDTRRAQAQLDQTLASIPPLAASIDRNIFRLAVLTGKPPAALLGMLEHEADLPAMPRLIAVGDASGLFRRRPDIRRAERNLAAATAQIGIEAADLFPTVSITGLGRLQSRTLGNLGAANSLAYAFGPQLVWNLLDFGRIRGRVAEADSLAVAAAANYEQVVLLAFEETEASLSAYGNEIERADLLRASSEAALDAARLARLRYRNGVDDFLQVLDAERVALENENLVVISRTQTFLQLIGLYKALGGGWQSAAMRVESGDGARTGGVTEGD